MNMKPLSGLAMVCTAFGLSGCIDVVPPQSASFGGLAGDAQAMFSANGMNSITSELPTAQTDVPTSGSATFSGYAGIAMRPDEENLPRLERVSDVNLIGELEMRATFTPSGGTFSATADNFYDGASENYGGAIFINGTLTRKGPSERRPDGQGELNGNHSGSLTGAGEFAGSYTEGELEGAFANGGDFVVGLGGGELALNSGDPVAGYILFLGAEKD